jgi:hypothetical protein
MKPIVRHFEKATENYTKKGALMIIVRLIGGLGNQMFQYAAGRALSVRNQDILKLDVSDYDGNSSRSYALSHFRIKEVLASQQEIQFFTRSRTRKLFARLSKFIPQVRRLTRRQIVLERHTHYDPSIKGLCGDIYLAGYWNSEKYFKDIEEIIRHEFRMSPPVDAENRSLARRIISTNSVNIHVRRGDYATDPAVNAVHGLCSMDYYRKAIAQMVKRVRDAHFFVFSDEQEWVTKNLKLFNSRDVTYVTHNRPDEGWKDFYLMTLCKHHIIANSTFSWWGAYLSDYPGKVVYAPSRWFLRKRFVLGDLIPSTWNTI